MGRKGRLLLALAALAPVLSSCALVPQEDSVRTAPMLREYAQEEYEFAVVERGDLIRTEKVSARYVPVQEEALSFSLVDEYVDRMFVQAGDSVVKGQLLGQLRLDDLEKQIADAESSAAELELRLEYLEMEYDIALRRHEIETEGLERMSVQEALTALDEEFALRRRELEDSLSLAELELSALKADLASRQLRAPFDGTVAYVREYEEGDRAGYGETAVRIADSTLTLFRAETKNWHCLRAGDLFDVEVNKQPCTLQVVSEEEIGIEPQEKTEGKKAYVYFMLTDPGLGIEEDDYASVVVELERHEDVLHVPADAVMKAGEISLVYYQREDGMKGYKEVVPGATIGKRTEIISGLEEGERIIAG